MFTFGKTFVAVSVFHASQKHEKVPRGLTCGPLYISIACTDKLEVYLHDANLDFVYLYGFLVFCLLLKIMIFIPTI